MEAIRLPASRGSLPRANWSRKGIINSLMLRAMKVAKARDVAGGKGYDPEQPEVEDGVRQVASRQMKQPRKAALGRSPQ